MSQLVIKDSSGRNIKFVYADPPSGIAQNPKSYLTNDQIISVLSSGEALTITDKLIVEYERTPDDYQSGLLKGNVPVIWKSMAASAFWGFSTWFQDSDDQTNLRNSYNTVFRTLADVTISNLGAKAEIDFNDSIAPSIEQYFESTGRLRPQYGFIFLNFQIHDFEDDGEDVANRRVVTLIVKTQINTLKPVGVIVDKNKSYIQASFTSAPYAYEALHVPVLSGAFVYNYYEVSEDLVSENANRNYSLAKLSSIPKYIHLSWTKSPEVTVPPGKKNGTKSSSAESFSFRGRVVSRNLKNEEESLFLKGKTKSSDNLKTIQADDPQSLGITQQEDEILSERIRLSTQPDSIAGPNDYSRYIGYVVYKEIYDEDISEFVPIDLIVVLDNRKTSIVDAEISYNKTYRYRVRSIFKFVNSENLPLFSDKDTIVDQRILDKLDSALGPGIFYYDSRFSNEAIFDIVDEKRPSAPFNVQIYPDSINKKLFITWNQKQDQRDVVGFNVYRRTTDSAFRRINFDLIQVRNNFFIDKDVKQDVLYIYAIESVDVHDNFSTLSSQCASKILEQNFEFGRSEFKSYIFEQREMELGDQPQDEVSNNDSVRFSRDLKFYINPIFQNLDRETNFLIKITSLDTFIEKQLVLNFKFNIITHRDDDRFAPIRDSLTKDIQRTSVDVNKDLFGTKKKGIKII